MSFFAGIRRHSLTSLLPLFTLNLCLSILVHLLLTFVSKCHSDFMNCRIPMSRCNHMSRCIRRSPIPRRFPGTLVRTLTAMS
ncbi:hypothetical protein C8J56DRAFT_332920 [Mycena floridula]|nr:hypothetical protein C8J56DRAFT_332920 [Mycena floridula]